MKKDKNMGTPELLTGLIALLLAVLGYFLKEAHQRIKEAMMTIETLRRDLSHQQIMLASDYVRRNELRDIEDKLDTFSAALFGKIDTLTQRVDSRLNTLADRVDSRVQAVQDKFDKRIDDLSNNLNSKQDK
jgi:hypothetical protein